MRTTTPILFSVATALAGCDADQTAWERAVGADDDAAYTAYVDAHPEGAHVEDARTRIDALRWRAATAADDKAAYAAYLEAGPDGAHIAEARDRIAALDWSIASEARAATGFAAFAEAHPDDDRAATARRLADRLPLEGLWVLRNAAFRITTGEDGAVTVEAIPAPSDEADDWRILETSISDVAADGERLQFHHTIKTESRSGTGVVINGAEIVTVFEDERRSEYDVSLSDDGRLRGVNSEGYLGVGSRGFFERPAVFYRIAEAGAAQSGLAGAWAATDDDPPLALSIGVDETGSWTLALPSDAAYQYDGAPGEAQASLAAESDADLAFAFTLSGGGRSTTSDYACAIAAAHALACSVTTLCTTCTEASHVSVVAYRVVE